MEQKPGKLALLVFGYAMHLTVISFLGWNGTLLYLPVARYADTLLSCFNATQLVAFPLTFVLAAFLAYRRGTPSFVRWWAWAAFAATVGGVLIILESGLNAVESGVGAAAAIAGALVGFGNAAFFVSWQAVFSMQDARTAGWGIVGGTAVAGIAYYAATRFEGYAALFFALLVLSFGAMMLCLLRALVMAEMPECPRAGGYRECLGSLWRVALCVASLGFARGVAPALVLSDATFGPALSTLMALGRVVSAGVLLLLWRGRIPDSINIDVAYKVAFPLFTTGFVLLPFLGTVYRFAFAVCVYIAFSVASLLMMMLCLQEARQRALNPLVVYGCFAGFVYTFSKAGFAATYYVRVETAFGLSWVAVIAMFSVYLLSLVFFVSRTRRAGDQGDSAGLAAGAASSPDVGELLEMRCAALAGEYGLSERETEIVALLAQGRDVPYISEALFVSKNTVHTHCKNVYKKMGVHGKQELLSVLGELGQTSVEDRAVGSGASQGAVSER